ncbi:MAG TPA: thioesterase family protein [Caulobacterales bacterium]|nr:thioesterase family protein [Caulobacterales bacterium]
MGEKWIEMTRALVHPWLCDSQDHLNTRHHAAMFDEASWLVLGMIGYKSSMAKDIGLGWADVKHTTEFKNEAPLGAFLRVESTISRVGNSSITICHRMLNTDEDSLVATFEGITVAYDLATRKSQPLPPQMKESAASLFAVV